jgi:hypothetical protein
MRTDAITVAIALGLAMAPPASVLAESRPGGIAFAQAADGTWWCRDSDARKATRCALDKCARDAAGEDCVATRWCAPAGWSGLMVTWLPEFRGTVILCGAASEAAVRAGLKALCEAGEDVTRCDLFGLIDPDGVAHQTTDLSWPGPAAGNGPAE